MLIFYVTRYKFPRRHWIFSVHQLKFYRLVLKLVCRFTKLQHCVVGMIMQVSLLCCSLIFVLLQYFLLVYKTKQSPIICSKYSGELHSRLEILTTQAKDLSLSAIKNSRWGHAIASSAIAEQISHNPRTMRNFSDLSSSSKMSKSKSLANFSSFAIDLSSAEESPASVQISGSESSASEYINQNDNFTENDDNDQDDCQEWAAGLVADVDNLEPPFRSRSFSVTSYDSFRSNESSSPIDSGSSYGFWRVHPGDTEIEDNSSWARSSSSPSLHSISSRADISINDCVEEIPIRSSVTFMDIGSEEKVNHSDVMKKDQKPLKENPAQISSSPPARQGYGLVRSHSYSAFSCRHSGEELSSTTPALRNRSNSTESDIFRQYFHKFIDLLIERETLAAARRKAKSSTKV